MATTTTNVHSVVSATVQHTIFGGFVSTEVVLTTADGSTVSISAFSEEPLVLQMLPARHPNGQAVQVAA